MRSLLLGILGLVSVSFAGTYYVDFAGGSNANSGTSPSAAWKNCPGDSAATSVPASTTPKPGDMIIFKGGVVYYGQVGIPSNGTSSAPIILDGNSAGTFGNGKAIIDGQNLFYHGIYSRSQAPTWLWVRNFEVRNLKYNATAPWVSGIGIEIDYASHCTISDCYIHDIGYWKNDGSIVPAGAGIYMIEPVNCLITRNEVTKTGLQGIAVNGAQYNVISHNNVHSYLTWGIDVGGDYQLCIGNTICDNTVWDLYYYDAGYWGAAGDPPHTDYVFIRMGSGQHPLKNIVERNLFYNNRSFTEFGGTAMVFLSYADSTIIRNNVFINPHEYYAANFNWTSAGTKFYNNTIYGPRSGGCMLSTNGHTDIRNNIFIVNSQGINLTNSTDLTGFTCDYNSYVVGTAAQLATMITPYSAWTFSAWRAKGYDTHSTNPSSAAVFNFKSTSGYPTACQTMDLHLASGSTAINSGSVLPGFATDKDSTARSGSSWDIGAYQIARTSAVVQGTPAPREAPGKAVENLFPMQKLNSMLSSGDYKVYDLSGRNHPAGSISRNMVYILRDLKMGKTMRIMVEDK